MKSRPVISASPQIHAPDSTRTMMAWVLVAAVPALLWSVFLFGMNAAWITAASVAAAAGTELVLNIAFKRPNTLGDLSAVVTGVLIGLGMPPGVPLFIPIAASIFAIAVVKWSFGGLGANWMNPALAGRVFVFYSWGPAMSRWTLPRPGGFPAADAVSGPTPLEAVKASLGDIPAGVDGPMRLLESAGTPSTYLDLFLGRTSGSIGETSAMLLVAGGLLLVFLKIVNWEIPVAYLASFALFVWIFDGIQYGGGAFSGDVAFHLLAGGLMLGCWLMATDPATTPITWFGRVIFGVGCGILTFVIRRFGNLPEGVSLAIIMMNIVTPLIDRHIRPKRYGASP